VPTSILDIDVDDSKFRRFADTYKKYQESLSKMGGSWGAVGKEIGGQNEALRKMTAAMLAQQELMRKNTSEGEKFRRNTDDAGRSMTKMARDSLTISRNIAGATLDLMKWSGIAAVVGGLLGAGGLWGIDKLAGSAAGALRSSRGLGIGSSEQQAFGINYQRFFDPNTVLSNVANAQSSYAQRVVFEQLGIKDYMKKDPAQLAVEAADKARQMFMHSDRSTEYAGAMGLTNIFSMDELRRMAGTGDEEWSRARSGYAGDVRTLAVDPAIQSGWQDFVNQMNRASTTIENVFIKALIPLKDPLIEFSRDLTGAIESLMGNPHMKEWIKEFGAGLESLAKYLGSDEFVGKMRSLGTGLEQLATKIGSILGWFGITGKSDAGGGSSQSSGSILAGLSGEIGNPADIGPYAMPNPVTGFGIMPTNKWLIPSPDETESGTGALASTRRWLQQHGFEARGTDANGRAKSDILTGLEKSRGLPPGLLDSIWYKESGRGANKGPSSAGALGDFQFTDETAKQYGITDRNDFGQEARGAADYMQGLLSEFGGNLKEAVAAYNAGPGKVEQAIQQYGNGWLSHMKPETQDYVSKVTAGLTIRIENNTGANVVVSTAALLG
jgi:Transglycosylase SLT domain